MHSMIDALGAEGREEFLNRQMQPMDYSHLPSEEGMMVHLLARAVQNQGAWSPLIDPLVELLAERGAESPVDIGAEFADDATAISYGLILTCRYIAGDETYYPSSEAGWENWKVVEHTLEVIVTGAEPTRPCHPSMTAAIEAARKLEDPSYSPDDPDHEIFAALILEALVSAGGSASNSDIDRAVEGELFG